MDTLSLKERTLDKKLAVDKIREILSDGRPHSGEEIASALGESVGQVNFHIQKLRGHLPPGKYIDHQVRSGVVHYQMKGK